ncbi:hypothetical protein HMPREF0872_03295 [Veillonella montpellierensis DNF00314]|uniref:Uncharacterized protein n=1 Tax=Veillonella montpellierensis DNF00314 TaxID=1401067 RepID=A0A096CQY3_9FIRM|nr:hypothetical protein [Veillonella montpellierensis]KGF47744.1 hypothetical protein HMPREF0872_03295 [Veillonella montpellierensis DNF00314]
MKIIYQEDSQRSKSAELLIGILILGVIAFIIYTTYRSITSHIILVAEYFIEIVTGFVLLKNAVGRYRYILTEDQFIIEEQSLFRKKHFEVPYTLIDGVYAFRQEIMGQLRFRYKYRKCSTADSRPVYAMAYEVVDGRHVRHARVLIKAEDAFFDLLSTFVPNRIRVSQEEVVFYAIAHKDAIKHGETVEEYLSSMRCDTNI